jgi:glycopeptide antibiotics resistance protein
MIFDKSLSQKEIKGLTTYREEFFPLLYYSFTDSSGSTVIDRGKGQPANLRIHRYFRPYKRILLEQDLLPNDWRYHWGDILINIVGFIPLGFLFSLYLKRKGWTFRNSLFLSAASGLTISLIIEVLQAFLPSRSSGMTDIITNTLGTIIGFCLHV